MITEKVLQQRQLDELYDWVDSRQLSRPKKNISRDFSDALMMAEIIALEFPKIVDLHNYPPTNSIRGKLSNWTTLNNKVLSRIGINLTAEDCKRLSQATPLAIEALLFQFKSFAQEARKEKEEEQRRFPDPFSRESKEGRQTDNRGNNIANKLYTSSKVEELKEVLSLLKEKIAIVERSIERKDGHIRQLEDTLRMYAS